MSENKTLFLFLCLLYLAECLVWTGRRSVVFMDAWRNGRWRVRLRNELFGTVRGSFLLANPWPPLGTVLRCSWLPVSIAPAGVTNVVRQTPPGGSDVSGEVRTFVYGDIRHVASDGKRLLVNGACLAVCATAGQAGRLVGLLSELRTIPAESRETVLLRFLDARHDTAAANARVSLLGSLPPMLSPLCLALFLLLYALMPAGSLLFGAGPVILVGFPLLFASTIWVACLFLRAHRRLSPDTAEGRVLGFLSLLLCPPAAIRARDRLAVDLLEAFDPVTVRLALGAAPDVAFYGALIRDLSHPLQREGLDAVTEEIADWFHAYSRRKTGAQLSSCGFRTEDWSEAPPLRPGTVYCPRCLCVFAERVTVCPECQGVATQAGSNSP